MYTKPLFFLILQASALLINAQLSVTPPLPGPGDSIEVRFDATQGNGALAGFSGPVYAHTGVLTAFSSDSSDWRFVVAPWGSADERVRMDSVGPDLYALRFRIQDFYGFPPFEPITHLAFVFRDAGGSTVGRDADGSDMFWPLAGAGGGGLGYASHTFDGTTLQIFSGAGLGLGLRAFGPDMIQLAPRSDTTEAWSSTLSISAAPQPALLSEFPDRLELQAGELLASIRKDDLQVAFVRGSDTLTRTAAFPSGLPGSPGLIRLEVDPGEVWQGAGSRAIPIDRRNRILPVYNIQFGAYGNGAPNLNIATPMAVSSRGYGLYWDHEGPASWNIGASDPGRLSYQTELDEPGLVLMAGSADPTQAFDQVLNAYARLTGRAVLPPRWAFGYIQSKYGYRNTAAALNTIDDLRSGGFPLDALVLDLYWFGGTGRMGDLAWDLSAFPDPPALLDAMRAEGVQPVLITEPYYTTASQHYDFLAGNDWLAWNAEGEPYVLGDFWTGPAALLDMTEPAARDWLWERHDELLQDGPLGWWSDLGEPETHPFDMVHAAGTARQIHNHYSLEWAKLLHDRYAALRPDERLFNLIRSGFGGLQRYGGIPWSGDVQRSWSGLEAQVPIMLGMSMSGMAWMHADMGGFTGAFDPELFLRWTQFGALTPLMRAHGIDNEITEPVYLSEPFRSHARQAVRLRYRLLPYLYSLAHQYAATGRPMALPLDYFDPQNATLQNRNDQYLFGSDLLVAPVLAPGLTSRSVLLPEGEWIDWYSGEVHSGPGSLSLSAPLGRIPLLIRAGAVLPLAPAQALEINGPAANLSDALLELHLFPGNNEQPFSGNCYLDDGISPSVSGNYEHLRFSGIAESSSPWLLLERVEGAGWPGSSALRETQLAWHRISTVPAEVTRDGAPMTARADSLSWAAASEGWWYDAERGLVWVRFDWDMSSTLVRLNGTSVGMPDAPASTQPSASLNTWPNPFQDELQIRVELPFAQPYTLHFFDSQGRELWSGGATDSPGIIAQQSLRLPALPAGLYLLELRYSGGVERSKVFRAR